MFSLIKTGVAGQQVNAAAFVRCDFDTMYPLFQKKSCSLVLQAATRSLFSWPANNNRRTDHGKHNHDYFFVRIYTRNDVLQQVGWIFRRLDYCSLILCEVGSAGKSSSSAVSPAAVGAVGASPPALRMRTPADLLHGLAAAAGAAGIFSGLISGSGFLGLLLLHLRFCFPRSSPLSWRGAAGLQFILHGHTLQGSMNNCIRSCCRLPKLLRTEGWGVLGNQLPEERFQQDVFAFNQAEQIGPDFPDQVNCFL